MRRSLPRRIMGQAFASDVGMPYSLAKTFTVPSGSTASRADFKPSGVLAMPLRTSLTVPSPPAATIVSKPSRTASAARMRAAPAAHVSFKAHCEPISSRWARKRFAFSPLATGLKMTHVRMLGGYVGGKELRVEGKPSTKVEVRGAKCETESDATPRTRTRAIMRIRHS